MYKTEKLAISIAMILILILLSLGGLFLFNNKTVHASETYRSSYATGRDSSGNTGYCYVYIYYDNTYVDSISISGVSTNVSTIQIYLNWTGAFTMGRTGYSWSSNAPTSFNAYIGSADNYSSSSGARDNAYSKANSSSGKSVTFSRNGNSFGLSSGSIPKPYAWPAGSIDWSYCAIAIKFTTSYSNSSYFTANTYTLTFDYNGGTGSTGSKTITYGSSIGSLPTATRADYAFQGWAWSTTSSSYISTGTTYSWSYNRTCYAVWKYDGYTLSTSVADGGGGNIIGANTQYSKNASVTVTASPNDGYAFNYWMLNDTKLTANPLTFTITQNSTLVAYFKEISTIIPTFSGATSTPDYEILNYDQYYYLTIKPASTDYVHSITISDLTFTIDYYKANVYNVGGADEIIYYVKDDSNIFNMKFEHLFATTNIQINFVTSKPTYKNPPSGGASIEGVGTHATLGGEARVNGFDLSNEDSIIHISALAYSGFVFSGWTANDGTDLSEYGISADIPYNLIKGKIITANFVPNIDKNSNGQTSEDSSGVI